MTVELISETCVRSGRRYRRITGGKLTGQKPAFKMKEVWSIRARLELRKRVRDLALFNLAIDSKLRGCDLVRLKLDDVELQRRVDAKDRIHFGPEGEDELEKLLRREFPIDDIQRRGRVGDIIHTIIENREPCATIVYECKRTTTWQADYLRQLKRAMEAHGTQYGMLVTRALPHGQSGLCVKDGIIIATPPLAHHLVAILRDMLIELSRVRLSEKGKEEKTAEIYRYLRSDEFKNILQSISSRTKELRETLEREKSSHEGWWSRREQHYAAIARQTSAVGGRINEILATPSKRQLAQVHRISA